MINRCDTTSIKAMLGIPKYEPFFFNDSNLFLKTHKDEFDKLIGKKIARFWVMWNVKEDEWYPLGPVILEIENNHYEFCADKLDDFSFTINAINMQEQLDWYGLGDEMPLVWKENGKQEMQICINLPIVDINILTYNFLGSYTESGKPFESGFMMHGIEFKLNEKNGPIAYFSIFNALDQNGLSSEKIEEGNQIKRIKIAGAHNHGDDIP